MRLRSKRILAKQKTTRYAGVSKKLYIKITFPYNRVKITGCFAALVRPQGSIVPEVRDAAFR